MRARCPRSVPLLPACLSSPSCYPRQSGCASYRAACGQTLLQHRPRLEQGPPRLQPQPQSNRVFHGSQFILGKRTKFAEQLDRGNGDKVLGIERSRSEEADIGNYFKAGTSRAGRVRHKRRQRASASPTETFKIRQGRVLAAMPRSTSHTSPRDGLGGIGRLASFKLQEKFLRGADKLLV